MSNKREKAGLQLGQNFVWQGKPITPAKVYGCSELQKVVSKQIFDFRKILKIQEKQFCFCFDEKKILKNCCRVTLQVPCIPCRSLVYPAASRSLVYPAASRSLVYPTGPLYTLQVPCIPSRSLVYPVGPLYTLQVPCIPCRFLYTLRLQVPCIPCGLQVPCIRS